MFYQPPRQETAQGYMEEDVMWPDDKAAYISDELVFKIIVMCEMVCYQLQKQGMLKYLKVTRTSNACYNCTVQFLLVNYILCYFVGNKKVTAAIAFSLALFSHVLNHVVIRLQSALYEAENPRKHLDVENLGNRNIHI